MKTNSAFRFSVSVSSSVPRGALNVDFLMNLLTGRMKDILDFCHEDKIKVVFSGRREGLSDKVMKTILEIEDETKDYDKVFNLCFNYGGHAEIVDATKKIVNDVESGKLNIDDLNEDNYSHYLYQDLPPVDLLIRTSGEMRLSNFFTLASFLCGVYFLI